MLRWNHDWGQQREHWNKLLEMGRPVPEPFLDQPEIMPESQFYWNAFCDLMTERSIGMGIGPIPISKAREYADRLEMDDREWLLFWSIIHDVDAEHITMLNKVKKDEPGGKTVSMKDPEAMRSHMESLKAKMRR